MESLEDRIWSHLPKSYSCWILAAILIARHVYVCRWDWIFGPTHQILSDAGALNAFKIDHGEWWRLGASLFLHGDLLHLSMNVLALIALLRIGEAIYGPIRALCILYVSGMVGAFFSWSMGATQTVGASGAIFGLLAALCVCAWKYRMELEGELGNLLRKRLIFWGIVNLLVGFVIPNIDNPSHIGGVVGGTILGMCSSHRWSKDWDIYGLAIVGILAIIWTLP